MNPNVVTFSRRPSHEEAPHSAPSSIQSALEALRSGDIADVSAVLRQAAEASSTEIDRALLCELQHELSRQGQGQDPQADHHVQQAQRHLETLITQAAAPLGRLALQDFIKALWPDGEQRMANSRRLFSLELPSGIAGPVKPPRRDADMPSRLDVRTRLENVQRFLARAGKGEVREKTGLSTQGYAWMSAHLKQAGEPKQGLKKAHDAYARSNDRASAAARQELAEVLSALAEGLDELSTPLRQEAHELIEDNLTALEPSVAWRLRARICQDAGQARACDAVAALYDLRRSNPPLETQKAVRDEVRTLLKDSHAWPPALRAGMADALAQAFLGRLALSADFSELRSWLVDDAVRRHDDARRRPPTVFRKSEQVVDLGKIDPPDDGVQSGDAKSYTRNALKLTIDDILYRVKDIKYGNVRAAEEVLMTRLLALTGIDCPNVKLAMNGDHLFSFTDKSRNDYRHHKDDPARFAVVASEMVPDFVDLGELVVDEGKMLPMLTKLHGEDGAARYREALENYQKAHDQEAKFAEDEKLGVLQPSTEKEKEALTLEKRKVRSEKFEAMKTIYAMLPESLKQDTVKAHYMSRLIKDWDFLNYNWRNFGFRCPGDDPQTWRPVAMDEGNAGTAGFGGQQAHNSFERAKVRAVEDDPEAPNQILRSEAVFDGNVGASRSGAATVARHRPSLPLIEEVIRSEIRMAEDGMYRQGLPAHEKKAFAGMLEAAYQMSFIPDEAFLRIAKESWPYDDDDFPPAEKDAAKLAVEKYAEILRERRDALVGKFSKADLAEWASQNPQRARTAYNDVSAAVAGMTGLHVEPPSQAGMAATI